MKGRERRATEGERKGGKKAEKRREKINARPGKPIRRSYQVSGVK